MKRDGAEKKSTTEKGRVRTGEATEKKKKKGRRGEMQRSSKSEMLLQGNRRRCEGDVYDLRQQRGEMQRSSKSEMLLQGNRRRCEGDVYDLRQQREGEGGASRRVRGGITSVVLCCAQERQQHIHHPDIRREHWIGFPSDAASRGGVSKVS
ncbi:hypothetical protein QE152_g33161 [Popillia japonica]|uniref:Uncharacterized protein n=1 Tax=Popillia japonica TaxID=7064 RepID=A0AAW1IY51_POPJA